MSATEINMSVDECFNTLDGLLGTDGYIAITEAVKKLVKQNNELKEENKLKFEKGWQVGKEDCMSDADEEIESLYATILERDEELADIKENVFTGYDEDIAKLKAEIKELKEQHKTPHFPKSDEVVQIGSLLTTYSNVMKWKQSHKEVEELKEQNEALKERAEDTFQQIADALCGEGDEADDIAGWGQEAKLIRKAKELKEQVKMFVSQIYNPKHEDELVVKKLNDEIKELKKKVEELEEPVFNADSRCNQFRVKVGYSYIHDILTEIHDMDLDTYDNDENDDDAGTLKCVEEFKGALFNECAGAINRIINHNISEEISQHIMEEIGNVVELFQRDEYIVEA